MEIPASLATVTADWLTEALHHGGAMSQGRIARAEMTQLGGFSSLTGIVSLRYDRRTRHDGPGSLFVKLSRRQPTPTDARWAHDEARFWHEIAPHTARSMADPPIPRPYYAEHDPSSGRAILLTEDLSSTHRAYHGPWPLTQSDARAAVDALARFHACWWDHPDLPTLDVIPNAEREAAYIADIERILPVFLDEMGERVSGVRCETYIRVTERLHRLVPRLVSGHNITIRHGDSHPGNLLYAKPDVAQGAKLIDWAFWNISVGTNDLCHIIALRGTREWRHRQERALVRRYHQQLANHGVSTYSWVACWRDYRASVIDLLFMPIWQWALEMPPRVWQPSLERGFEAFEDLHCMDLLR